MRLRSSGENPLSYIKTKCTHYVILALFSGINHKIHFCFLGACFHSMQRPKEREAVLENVKPGRVHFLLVSPETLAGGGALFTQVKFEYFLAVL